MGKVRITAIPKEKIDEYWPSLEGFFIAANKEHKFSLDRITPEQIHKASEAGDILILKIGDVAAMAFEIVGESFHCTAIGGESMNEWLDCLINYGESIAKKLGLKEVTIKGRMGWGKVLKQYDYERGYTLYGKIL